jgi:signal transduction histidine kinase
MVRQRRISAGISLRGSCAREAYREARQPGGIHAESKKAKNDSRSQGSRRTAQAAGPGRKPGGGTTGLLEHILNASSGLGTEEAKSLGEAVLELRPLLVVSPGLKILAANRRFCREFDVAAASVPGLPLEKLHDGAWNVPGLVRVINAVLRGRTRSSRTEFASDFPCTGRRSLDVTVLKTRLPGHPMQVALLSIVDLTGAGELRRAQDELLRSQSELLRLSAMLINSQEAERTRVARELHDELNQKLAMLTVTVERLGARVLEPELKKSLESLRTDAAELMTGVRELAHQLHPSILDHLGLEVALRSYCEDFSARGGIQVKYSVPAPPGAAPPEVELCLYRICQESLRNVAKHSGVRRAVVKLERIADEILLSIRDKGAGFDVDAAGRSGGIGLLSIRERARLVGGTATVHSHPGQGTEILVRVPIAKGAENV